MGAQKCETGTFNPLTGMDSDSACLPCLPGKACTEKGLGKPNMNCKKGYYCTAGARIEEPQDLWSDGGAACEAGYVCPEGSITARPCPSGSYCSNEKSGVADGPCAEGHFCAHHATEENASTIFYWDRCPSDTKQGICPAGSFCPEGATFPFKCPPGAFVVLVRGVRIKFI